MSIIYLRDHEARAYAQGRLGRITRVIVPQPLLFCSHVEPFRGEGGGWIAGDNTGRIIKAPYRPGDVLDAKETWARRKWSDGRFYYKATPELGWVNMDEGGWRSPVCMPSAAVRLHPVVARLVAQRVQEITEEDAILEGVERLFDHVPDEEYRRWETNEAIQRGGAYKEKHEWEYVNYLWHGHFGRYGMGNKQSDAWPYQYSGYTSARDSFSSLFERDNARRGYTWAMNPWCWGIYLERGQ